MGAFSSDPPKKEATKSDSSSLIPAFKQIGQAARDLFSKGFCNGTYQIIVKSKTENGIGISGQGVSCHKTGGIEGTLFLQKDWSSKGFSGQMKMNTTRSIVMKANLVDYPKKGVKVSVDSKANYLNYDLTSNATVAFKNNRVNASLKIPMYKFLVGDSIGALVFGLGQNCHIGVQGSFNKQTLATKLDVGAQKVWDDSTIAFTISDWCEYVVTLFHKVNDKIEWGTESTYDAMKKTGKIGGVVHYKLNADAAAKGNHLSEACHQYGFGLQFEL